MKRTNFDVYLDDQMLDPEFAARFKRASDTWVVKRLGTPALDPPRNELTQEPERSKPDDGTGSEVESGEADVR